MNLSEAKLNSECIVIDFDIADEREKIRLMELGLVKGVKVKVVKKSVGKKTLLIIFNSSCFSLKDNLANGVIVNYV